MILTIMIPVAFGLLNGVLVAKLKLPAFIATLGTMMISQGLGSIITSVQTQRWPTAAEADGWFKTVFLKTSGGFPPGIFLSLIHIYSCRAVQTLPVSRSRFLMIMAATRKYWIFLILWYNKAVKDE